MNRLKRKTDILIAGAGIAGCSVAQSLQAKGIDYLLLEKNLESGGLTRSINLGDAIFDYTGHFMHLSKCKSPAELPYANQNNEDWQFVKRKSVVYVDGEIVPAPFQYNLFYLSEAAKKQCIESYHSRPRIKKIKSFKEYLLEGFGQGICDYFLFPYNEKTMGCPIDHISVDTVKRFFPVPDKEKIEKGYTGEGVNPDTQYNSRFWYPREHGIGILAKGLAKGLDALQTNCPIEGIDLSSQCVYTRLGQIYYEKLLTSLPLKAFCTLTHNSSLHALAKILRYTKVFCLNLLIRGSFPEVFKGCHWIYIPDKGIPFYRIGIYTHISSEMNPKGTTALYVEAAFSDDAAVPAMNDLIDQIFSSLEGLGWINRKHCLIISANWIEFAYVNFDHSRQVAVSQILDILQKHKVFPIGRYGMWDYMSMEDTILMSIQTANALLQ